MECNLQITGVSRTENATKASTRLNESGNVPFIDQDQKKQTEKKA